MNEKFHIGLLIDAALKHRGMTGNELSRRMGKSENFAYAHTKNSNINTKNLCEISVILDTNLGIPLVQYINQLLHEKRRDRIDYVPNENSPPYGYLPPDERKNFEKQINELTQKVDRLNELLSKEREITILLKDKLEWIASKEKAL